MSSLAFKQISNAIIKARPRLDKNGAKLVQHFGNLKAVVPFLNREMLISKKGL